MTIHSALSQPWLMTIDGFQSMRRDAVDRASKLKENDYKPVSFLNFDSFIDSTPKASGGVGVISINGPLVKSSNLFSMLFGGTTSYEDIEAQIRNMASDDSIKRIVLDIDSPGGQVAGLSDLVDAIRKTDKEVIAYTSGSMASAAYWIGSAADKIVAGPQAMVGSIGTVLTMVDYTELDKKIGIEEIEIAVYECELNTTTTVECVEDALLATSDCIFCVCDLIDVFWGTGQGECAERRMGQEFEF